MSRDGKVELIKERADIVTIAERYIKLKQSGRNFMGLCPFHNEKTPSFNVSPDLQIFKCFGCGKSGDVITFVQEIEKLDFKEALEKLAKETGIQLDDNEDKDPNLPLYTLNNLASEIFNRLLKVNDEALKYLTERGITENDIDKFKIGFAPGNNIVLNKAREKFKLPNSTLVKSGLFVERNGALRDKFINRIMFPVTSSTGKIIAFTGRVLPGNNYGPKYLHTPETPIFHKSNNVYGLYNAKQAIRKEDLCIVCEGTTDVIAAHRVGISNIVAPLGTSITEGQLALMGQFSRNILFIFDSDLAGQRALERAFLISEKLNLSSYAINTTPFKDIDELVHNNSAELERKIKEEKIDAYTYLLSSYMQTLDLSRMDDKMKLKRYIKSLLDGVSDKTRLQFYIERTRNITGQLNSSNEKLDSPSIYSTPQISNRKLSFEELYLKALLSEDSITFNIEHSLEYFRDPDIIEIISIIKENSPIVTKWLHKKLNEQQKVTIENLILQKTIVSYEDSTDIYNRIREAYLKDKISEIGARLAIAENIKDNDEIDKLFKEKNDLMTKLRSLRK